MTRHGLADHIHVLPGGLTEEDGAAAARTLLAARPRPSAVLAFNDRCATGVLDAFLRAGVPVPDEMSVVGFDDSRLASRAHIDLTTVGQDIPCLAELAVGRAIARMEAEAAPGPETVIVPRLVVRATTAAPRRALS